MVNSSGGLPDLLDIMGEGPCAWGMACGTLDLDFDTHPELFFPWRQVMTDFHACSWTSLPGLRGSGDDSLAQHFDSLNDPGFQQLLRQLERQEAATGEERDWLLFHVLMPFVSNFGGPKKDSAAIAEKLHPCQPQKQSSWVAGWLVAG